MDTNAEALKIAKNLTPIIEQVTYRMTENCMRSKLYTVSSVPSGGKIGVKDAFDEVEMQVPYSSALSKARVGDAVWCVWMGSNQSTMVAMWEGDLVSTSETDAILHIKSPANSVVTISKGSYKKSSGGSVNASDPSVYDYYFVIHWWQQDEIPWLLTARLGIQYTSKEVVIDQGGEYDIGLYYHVPSEYQEVEYIQTTGTQYINTTIPAQYCWIDATVSATAYQGDAFLLTSVSSAPRLCLADTNGSNTRVFYNGTATEKITYGTVLTLNAIASVQAGAKPSEQFVTVNGTRVQKTLAESPTMTGNFSMFRQYGSTSNCQKVRLYSMKIYNTSDTLIGEMFPCYRKSDSVAGLWDRVNEVFLTNAGTGTFIVGEDIN